jgi:hypothetical protein
MLCDFEFVGWGSDASGYGVVRAKDGKQRVRSRFPPTTSMI